MDALVITDKNYQSNIYYSLKSLISGFLKDNGFKMELLEIGKDDLAFCRGCFGCWVKKPGQCVIDDRMTYINYRFNNSDAVIFLSPIIFGNFSSNIKNSLDRWIPNILPFFEIRPDGSTMHPARYKTYPQQIIIGYGTNLLQEDIDLFKEITNKHRRNITVLIYQGVDKAIRKELDEIELKRVGGQL